MADAAVEEEKAPAHSSGIPIKLVILIAGATLLVGLGGTIAYVKFSSHKEEVHTESSESQHRQPPANRRRRRANPKVRQQVRRERFMMSIPLSSTSPMCRNHAISN
jgi:hypothetical protein